MNYLVAAYVVSWVVVGGYVLLLGMRLRGLEEDLQLSNRATEAQV